jgi:hypothetical protein
MNHRISITKSRAGHYTVAIRNPQGVRVFIQDLISTLPQARRIAFEYMDHVNAAKA